MSIQNDMSIDRAIQYMEALVSNNPMFPPMKEAAKIAIDALHEKQEAENDEPLTLEELDKMDGQPVWITPSGFWALVYAREGQRTILVSNDRDAVYADREIALVGPVYRHPPKEGKRRDD